MLQEIYGEYTDLVEPYGCDEAWLDVTGSTALKGDEKKIADEIIKLAGEYDKNTGEFH